MKPIDIQRIFYPTDFSASSQTAFAHALKLAVGAKSILTIYHTDPGSRSNSWEFFPHVRQVLERWNLLPPHSPREAVVKLGLGVEKVAASHSDAVSSVLSFLHRHQHDLIVMTTHQPQGLDRYLKRSLAEPIARNSGECTLFLPANSAGFVSFGTGKVSLKNILIPVDHARHSQLAAESASTISQLVMADGVTHHLLHVGSAQTFPRIKRPADDSATWKTMLREGEVVEQILCAADDVRADLIVMVTQGHEGLLDALRGSKAERVVRFAKCPVLTLPADQVLRSNPPEIIVFETD
jgi:nucleotide-binding universal stress UspA family protein